MSKEQVIELFKEQTQIYKKENITRILKCIVLFAVAFAIQECMQYSNILLSIIKGSLQAFLSIFMFFICIIIVEFMEEMNGRNTICNKINNNFSFEITELDVINKKQKGKYIKLFVSNGKSSLRILKSNFEKELNSNIVVCLKVPNGIYPLTLKDFKKDA